MKDRRIRFHNMLLQITKNCYFQPPIKLKMIYPAVIYSYDNSYIDHADSTSYITRVKIKMTVVDTDPELPVMWGVLKSIPYTSLLNTFVVDGLYQSQLTTYI